MNDLNQLISDTEPFTHVINIGSLSANVREEDSSALYETVKYILKKESYGVDFTHERPQPASPVRQQLRSEEVNVIAGARQTDQLKT